MNVPRTVQPSLTMPPELYEPTSGSSYKRNNLEWAASHLGGHLPTRQLTLMQMTHITQGSEQVGVGGGRRLSTSSADDTSHTEVSKPESKASVAISASSADSTSSW